MDDSTSPIIQDLPRLIERMHRRYLDVVRIELARHGYHDISPVQAVMLGMIGGPNGTDEISVRDLIERGYYLSSNASYNIKNLADGAYIDRRSSERDKRSAQLKLTGKGRDVLLILSTLNTEVAADLPQDDGKGLEMTHQTLRFFEQRWTETIRAEPL